jgi:alcohol dehydrogenase class IV
MVNSFRFARLPEILFRNGSIAELPGLTRKFGGPVVLVTGKSSFSKSERGKKLLQLLEDEDIIIYHVSALVEPSATMIDAVVGANRDNDIKLVVAIGGGSVLDTGKAISAMLSVPGSVRDYLEGIGHREHPGTKIPFIAIPTTSGTGSEATKNAVISEVSPEGFKKSLRHDNFVPDMAILDPELTLNCPPEITSACGMDCFSQLIEAFLSDKASEYTDAFALLGLKAIKNSLVKSVRNGEDITARTDMSYAALNSGICLANAGLGTVHGFASSIGGRYNIPHGLICGTLMAVTNRVNVRELRAASGNSTLKTGNQALKKYAELGKLFLDTEAKADDYYIDAFIDWLYKLISDLQLPGLAGFGLEERYVEEICAQTDNKNNPVKLSQENLVEILHERLKS